MGLIMLNGIAYGGSGQEEISTEEGNILTREDDGSLYAGIEVEEENIDFSHFFD